MPGPFATYFLPVSTTLLCLGGCTGSIDINENQLVYGRSGAPVVESGSTKRSVVHPTNIARVSVLDTNVLKWSEIAQDLQAAQFNYSGNELYNMSIANTSSTSNSYVDQFLAKVAATLGGAQRDNLSESVTDAAGNTTTTGDRKITQKTPAAPDYALTLAPPQTITSGVQGATSGIETLTRLQEAAALAEEIAILNKRVSGVSMPRGYVPYFVSFQIGVSPTAHGYPYDTTIHLRFDPSGFRITDTSTADGEDAIQLAHPGDGDLKTACDGGFTGIEVMPLLVTDSLESTTETDVSEIIRQLGASIKGSAGLFGGGGEVERALTKINQSQAMRLNSLLSVTREGRSCIAVRLGANRYGNAYEMVSRNHNVSVVVLVPEVHVQDAVWLSSPYRTPKIKVAGVAEFNDPVWYLKGRPFPDPDSVKVPADYVNLPLVETPACPPQQEAILTSAVAPNTLQAPELDKSVVILNASRGIDLSNVTAQLLTPTTLSGERLSFTTQEVSSILDGELRFQFPAQSGLFQLKAAGQVQTGYIRFTVITDGLLVKGSLKDNRHVIFCPTTWDGSDGDHDRAGLERSAYKVAYVIAAAPKPVAATKPTAAKVKAAPAASASAATAAAIDPGTQAPGVQPGSVSSSSRATPTTETAPKVTLPY